MHKFYSNCSKAPTVYQQKKFIIVSDSLVSEDRKSIGVSTVKSAGSNHQKPVSSSNTNFEVSVKFFLCIGNTSTVVLCSHVPLQGSFFEPILLKIYLFLFYLIFKRGFKKGDD